MGSSDSGLIGTDELGVPLAISMDSTTSVTIGERDRKEQIRVSVDEVASVVKEVTDGQGTWTDALQKYTQLGMENHNTTLQAHEIQCEAELQRLKYKQDEIELWLLNSKNRERELVIEQEKRDIEIMQTNTSHMDAIGAQYYYGMKMKIIKEVTDGQSTCTDALRKYTQLGTKQHKTTLQAHEEQCETELQRLKYKQDEIELWLLNSKNRERELVIEQEKRDVEIMQTDTSQMDEVSAQYYYGMKMKIIKELPDGSTLTHVRGRSRHPWNLEEKNKFCFGLLVGLLVMLLLLLCVLELQIISDTIYLSGN